MTSHQNGPQITSGLGRQNQSMLPGTRYASVQHGVATANQLVPTDQSQLVYIVPQGPPMQYQTTQSAADTQQNMFVQVQDPQMFGPHSRARSPGSVFNSQQQDNGQLFHEQRGQHEQRLLEHHLLGTAILPIPEIQGNKELPKEHGTVQRHRQQASAAIVDSTSLEVMTTTNGRLSASASSENQRNTESRITETILSLSSATGNALGKHQHVNNSQTVKRHANIQADTYEFGKTDESKTNTSSTAILWSSTPAPFVSASLSGEHEPSRNLPVATADHSEQNVVSSDNTESLIISKYLAHSSKPDVVSATPAKPSAKRVRKATATPATKSAKTPATKPATKAARKPTQRSQARSSEVATSTSSTADNEDPATECQQSCNELVGQSHITVSPDNSGCMQSQMSLTQDNPFSSTLLSAYITSKSAMGTASLASHYAPEDHLVWARKLAHQAVDAKKQFDSLTERLSNDEGKWGELMQKHTASVRKAVSELKKDVRDRATQLDNSTEQIQAVCNSVKEYVAVTEERINRLDAAVLGLTSEIAELTATVNKALAEMSKGETVAPLQQESQTPKVAPSGTIDDLAPRGWKRAREEDITDVPPNNGLSPLVRGISEPLDQSNVQNAEATPIGRRLSAPIPSNENHFSASITADDVFVPHYTFDTRRKLTSSSQPPSEACDEDFETKNAGAVCAAVNGLAAS
ncbi:uncharacterized protein V1513DRAFT_446734 [Lipomyces chichibuensis]|uniref:uncharacterized protein n=1 Tax=Lipomyces chichibuensis TaxID=1546026 RepID=UPI0033436171